MKMCIQADLDDADALRHMNKNNSERAVCITHPLAPISTSFLFVFDTERVMSTSEQQGRDIVLQTGVKIHWSRRSASSCFNRVWMVTKSCAKQKWERRANLDRSRQDGARLTTRGDAGVRVQRG